MLPRIATAGLLILVLGGGGARPLRAERAAREEQPATVAERSAPLDYAPPALPGAPDTAAMLHRLVTGTVIVLLLCVVTLLAGRRWLRGAPAGAGTGRTLRLLETVSLGNRCVVHLLQTRDCQVLVGVDGGGIRSLVPLPAAFEAALSDEPPAAFDPLEPAPAEASDHV